MWPASAATQGRSRHHRTARRNPPREKPSRTTTGRVLEVRYDCAGHIEAFALGGCCEHAEFRASEPGLSRILLQAMRHRLRVTVTTCPDEPHHVESVSVCP